MPLALSAAKNKIKRSSCNSGSLEYGAAEDVDDESVEFFSHGEQSSDDLVRHAPRSESHAPTVAAPVRAENSIPASVELFARHFATTGDWDYEGGDLVPGVLTALPGWADSGVVLNVETYDFGTLIYSPRGQIAGRNPESGDAITIRQITPNHYVAVVDELEVDVGDDGNCLFYSVWYALDSSVPEATRRKIYQGAPPENKTLATQYFRSAGARFIRQNPQNFFDSLNDEQSDNDEYFDAAEYIEPVSTNKPTPDQYIRRESERFTSGERSYTGKNPTPDELPVHSDSDLQPPPFSLSEIARAAIAVVGNFATEKLIAWGVSIATAVLPQNISYILFGYHSIYEALKLLKNGAYIDAFLSSLSSIPFELLSEVSLVALIADYAFAFLRDYAPWISTALKALNLSMEMNGVNIFALSLVAIIHNFVVKKWMPIHPEGYAQSFIRLVSRLRKISTLYCLIEKSFQNNAFDEDAMLRDVRQGQAERRDLLHWARSKFGENYVSRLGLTSKERRDDPLAFLAALRDGRSVFSEEGADLNRAQRSGPDGLGKPLTESPAAWVGERSLDYAAPAVSFTAGDWAGQNQSLQSGTQDSRELHEPVPSDASSRIGPVRSRLMWLGIPLVVVSAGYAAIEDIASFLLSANPLLYVFKFLMGGTFLGIAGIFSWVVYKNYFCEVSDSDQDRQALFELFDARVSEGRHEYYDPIPWGSGSVSVPTDLHHVPERFLIRNLQSVGDAAPVAEASSEIGEEQVPVMASGEGQQKPDYSPLRSKIRNIDKERINGTITDFLDNSHFHSETFYKNSGVLGYLIDEAWKRLSIYLCSILKGAPFTEDDCNSKLFSIITHRIDQDWPVVHDKLKEMSSEKFYGKDLLNAWKAGNLFLVEIILIKACAVEVFRSKILGDILSFPYLEPIFGLGIPEVHIENLPIFLQSMEEGYWNSTDETGNVIPYSVLSTTKILTNIFICNFKDISNNPSAILENIGRDDWSYQTALEGAIEILEREEEDAKRFAYVANKLNETGADNLNRVVLMHYAFLRGALTVEDYLKAQSKIYNSPQAYSILEKFNAKSGFDRPQMQVYECMAAAVQVWLLLNPGGKHGNGAGLSGKQYREIYDEMLSGSGEEDRNELMLIVILFYHRVKGVSMDELALHAPSAFLDIKRVAEVVEADPVVKRINNKLAHEGVKYLHKPKTNAELGDWAYFQQFEILKKKFMGPLSELVSAELLINAVPDLYELQELKSVEVTVFDCHGVLTDKKDDLESLLDKGGAPKNVKYGRDPTASHEKYPGNVIVIKIGNTSNRKLLVVSTLHEQLKVKYFDSDSIRKSETLTYFSTKSNSVLAKDALENISLDSESKSILPKGSAVPIMGKRLREQFIGKMFDDIDAEGYSIGNLKSAAGYLVYNDEKSKSLKSNNVFDTVDLMVLESLSRTAVSVKANNYTRPWWQYITIWLPFFDSIYFRYMDPDFSQEIRSLLFDVVDLFTAARAISAPLKILAKEALRSTFVKLTGKSILKIGSISYGKILSETRNLLCFWIPTGLVPMGVSAKLGSVQKIIRTFDVRFETPILIIDSKGVIDWLSSVDNGLLLANLDAFIIGYQGRFGFGNLDDAQIDDYVNVISSKNATSSKLRPEIRSRIADGLQLPLLNVLAKTVVKKYEFVDGNGNVSEAKYAFVLKMKDGNDYVIDRNVKVAARYVSNKADWMTAVNAGAAGKRMRSMEFDSMDDARNATLSIKNPYLDEAASTVLPGEDFSFKGGRFYKAKGGEYLTGIAKKYYDYNSLRNIFMQSPLNKKIGKNLNLEKDVVIALPYLEWRKIPSIRNGGLIISEVKLPYYFDYAGWKVIDNYPDNKIPAEVDENSAARDSDNQIIPGTIFVRDGTRFYKVGDNDTLESITRTVYGPNARVMLSGILINWPMNIINIGSNYWPKLVPGSELAIPYVYKARSE